MRAINAPDVQSAAGGYSQAVEFGQCRRTLLVSGQIPVAMDGQVPPDFAGQCRLAWANVTAQLRAAGMDIRNLAKVTIFLSDRRYAVENRAIRNEVLQGHAPALTVIITGIFDEAWLLEIEALAVEE
jgi:enamine deaminase RidA (YjgF/YER057c/UK114 family)